MNRNIKSLRALYTKAKESKVGEICQCPSCGVYFCKTNYQQSFCKTKGGTVCKDFYWNMVTPSKRNNTTRISPANARYYNNVILPEKAREFGFPDIETMRGFVDETDSMSVHVENCNICGLRPEYCECGEGSSAEYDL